MSETVKFSIDHIDIYKEDERLMIAEMYVVSVGNNKHNLYIGENAILDAKQSLIGKPVCAIWNDLTNDVTDHAKNDADKEKRVCVGFVPESANLEMVEYNGKKFLKCMVVLWKHYFPKITSKLASNTEEGKNTDISMEIIMLESHDRTDGLVEIDKFEFIGIALLGDTVTPAIEDANIKIIKFSTTDYDDLVSETNQLIKNFSEKKGVTKMLTSKQLRNLADSELSQYKYTVKYGDSEYEYEKYWVKDNDNEYLYVRDCEQCTTYRMKYTLNETEPISIVIDVEGAEKVIEGGYVVVAEGQEVQNYSELITAFSELQVASEQREKDFSEVKEKLELKEKDFSKLKEDNVKMEKEFSETKTKLEDKEKEFSALSNDFEAFKTDALVKFSRLNQLEKEEMDRNEKLFSDNTEALIKEFSDFLSKDDMQVLDEVKKQKDFSAFNAKVNEIVLPKMSEQFKVLKEGKTTTGNLDFSVTQSNPVVDLSDDKKVETLDDRLRKYLNN